MSKAISLEQLELHAIKSANYTDKKIAELSEDVADAIEEMAGNLSSQTNEKIEAHLQTKEYATRSEMSELENAFAGALFGMYGDDASATPPTIREIANDAIDKAIESGDIKGEVVQDLIAELKGLPVFGVVDENNVVTVTSLLANGTYTLKYENAAGSTTEIGTITVGDGTGGGSGAEPTVYEVDIAAIGYTDNARWSTSGGDIRTNIGMTNTAINLVPFTRASGQTMTIHLSGITWTGGSNVTAILFFTDGTYGGSSHYIPLDAAHDYMGVLGAKTVFNSDGSIDVIVTNHPSGTLYNGFKVCGTGTGANARITYTIE